MSQDSLSSRIYKSFLTCNDPKGIVDKSTVRRKKAPSKMEKWNKNRRASKNLYEFSDCKLRRERTAIKEVRDEISSSSSSQLMEVSRGAQKLNRTIDLWSNGMKYDTQSDQIARDLFEGALDLQQSLVILGKLQEASRYMTQMKKNERTERKTNGNMGMERTGFNRNEFHKPQLSADYSYGDGADELKKVIRDHLARQLIFPNSTNMAERISFPESSMESSASDFASTSSSQSSMMYNTATNPAKKGNGKNLIAKLMGLEPQSSQMYENLHKQFLDEKISDRQRPEFSMEVAETKKPKSAIHKIAQKTSESNTQQSKGILKHPANEVNDYFNYSSYSHSREESTHAAQPIVLLKPVRVSQVEWEERQAQVFEEEEALNKKKFMKLKMKEKYHQQKNDNKVEALCSKKMFGSIGAEETAISRIYHRKVAQYPKEEDWKPKECINVIKPKKRTSHILLDQNFQKKEATDKKGFESRKDIVARKNLLVKSKIAPKFQDEVKGSLSKLQRKPNVIEEPIPHDSTPTSDTAPECSPFSVNQAIAEKVINEVFVEKSPAINFGGKSNLKKPDQTYSPASLLDRKEKGGSSRYQTCDYCSESQSSLIHSCRKPESSKYIDHEISVTKPASSPKTPISINSPPSSHKNELNRLNANGSSRIWVSPEDSPANACDGVEFLRNYRKINEATNGIFGVSCRWPVRESMKEAEEVVEDLEERILVGLIHEVFA
ncbi:hypothetical protein IC582_011958 [Cucumis melo]|uniref:Uncharacterized protein LOC103497820 n=2 Tax=Cucumis melo TaxID=3656 RepID=A0A1S3C7S3_CUCME|nr:uncharacterized protein LOC103497820 [Cucumis melo]KAA0061551.1 biorientation of chromosomes in cell division protein 1-like 1 [Cucumis melo var. makuwa]TYK10721.1 biorientation of chromosomes in cell division protein 1-like 1 [Cucumis melo var. makuwa]